jgi:MFS family permease
MTTKRIEGWLFVLMFVSYAYFYQAGGWNQNSRFNLVRAITNEHSLQVDPFQRDTGDKAVYGGHFYSDKAPGQALAAVPSVLVARGVMALLGMDPESYAGIALLSYLATVFTSGLFTALGVVVLFRVAETLGATRGGALFAAITCGLGTPMWSLATLLIGHALSASCLVFAFAAALAVGVADQRRDAQLALVVGLGAGWATVSDFPAAVPAVILAVLAALNAWPLGHARATRILVVLIAAASACAAVLAAYQYACFGSPFHVAYSSEQGFEGMRQGLFGISAPRLFRLREILLGAYRGLLPLAPALLAAPLGLVVMLRAGTRARRAALAAGTVAAYYVLLNASYTYWEGGWSYGPRHLSPALPFICLWLAFLWAVARRLGRAALVTLAAWGVAMSLVAVATMNQPPGSFHRPMAELLWPAFADGDLSLNRQRFTDGGADAGALRVHGPRKAAWNLGMKVGLDGHASLAPLGIIWVLCGLGLCTALREPDVVRAT